MIFILTGEVHSGKTTSLQKWLGKRKDIGGFLSPDIESRRYLLNPNDNESISFQVDHNYKGETLTVGPYIFSKEAFAEAEKWTMHQLEDESIKWIVIDELGKLEMKKEGFFNLAKELVKRSDKKQILIVVRDFLLDAMIDLLQIKDYQIVSNSDLERINK